RGSLSYVVSAPGSQPRTFSRHSIAWVSVCSGEPRWWSEGLYTRTDSDSIVLFDNVAHVFPDGPRKFHLPDYFEERADRDYAAFIVLPIPSKAARRGRSELDPVGGLHISFKNKVWFQALWPSFDDAVADPKAVYDPGLSSLLDDSNILMP